MKSSTSDARGTTRSGSRVVERLADVAELCKLRIGAMVCFAAFVGGALSGAGSLLRAAEAGLYVMLLAAGASAFNQLFERDVDRLMPRTRERPLPAGRLRPRDAIAVGGTLCAVGALGLALRFNVLAALLGLATLCGYALVYTPLKRISYMNTVVGAIPGAMPPLIGYAALANEVSGWGWYLFAVLFTWQFPHFLAIAWMYRDEYAAAGLKMLPSLPGAAGVAGRQALLYSLVLVPLSVLPVLRGDAGWTYAVGALALGCAYAAASLAFARSETRPRARVLLFVSLGYLPLLFALALADPVVRQLLHASA